MTGTSGGPGSKGTPGANEVWIQGMAFTPVALTVVTGTTIVWTNKDAISHTVTSDAGLFDSGPIKSGDTFSYTFSAVGAYTYHCSIHPTMMGSIIVTTTPVTNAAVSIYNMSFVPSTVTISAGTSVTWTNNDSMNHTVTSDTGVFNSGVISTAGAYGTGGSFTYTFNTPGTYPYHCTIHPTMTGSVIVN